MISFPGAGQLTVYKTASQPLSHLILTAMLLLLLNTHLADGETEAKLLEAVVIQP